MKAILAVTAGGERYRLGHYGAITKVPRGNFAGKGMLLSASRGVTSTKERKAQPFPIRFFQEAILRRFGCREGSGRLERFRGAGSLCDHPSGRAGGTMMTVIGGIAMYLAGPESLKLLFHGFVVLVGLLILAAAQPRP